MFDGQHDVQQQFDDLRVPLTGMIPGIPAKFGGTPIRASDKKYHTG